MPRRRRRSVAAWSALLDPGEKGRRPLDRTVVADLALGLADIPWRDGLIAWLVPTVLPTEKIDRTDPDVRLGWLIIIGTIPIVIVGFIAQEYIRSTFRSLWLVAIVLIVFGILLGLGLLIALAFRGFPANVVPTTILLDRSNRVAAVYIATVSDEDLRGALDQLIAEEVPG